MGGENKDVGKTDLLSGKEHHVLSPAMSTVVNWRHPVSPLSASTELLKMWIGVTANEPSKTFIQ